jgi:hypothetical protein
LSEVGVTRACAACVQVWRLFTNFFFFGSISLDFFFHMFFLVRYCRMLEEGSFRGRPAGASIAADTPAPLCASPSAVPPCLGKLRKCRTHPW